MVYVRGITTMNYVYLYVEKNVANDCIKYGMKLSEFADKIILIENIKKRGITAYLCPRDCELYSNKSYLCLKIKTNGANIHVFNKISDNDSDLYDSICNFNEYEIGKYEDPICIICSSILPENIYEYNTIIDTPLLIENSKEFFYERLILNLLDDKIKSKDIINYLKNIDH